LALLPFLLGCEGALYVAAHAGMAASALLQARPDRKLEYLIEIETVDQEKLVFSGATECAHAVRIPTGARYSTKTRSSAITRNGVRWILDGIDCQNEIVEKQDRRYRLYKETDEQQAKVYLISAGLSGRIVRASFDSSIWFISKSTPDSFERFGYGPYLYQKLFILYPPAAMRAYKEPVVVYQERSTCGQQNELGVSFNAEEFNWNFLKSMRFSAVEEGFLEYRSNEHAWTTKAGIDPTMPFDVARRAPPSDGCVRLLIGGKTYVVHQASLGAFLYVPAESAYYRIAPVWDNVIKRYVTDESDSWKQCAKPQGRENFERGTMYLTDPGTDSFRVARQNPDGSFSCKPSFSYLGIVR